MVAPAMRILLRFAGEARLDRDASEGPAAVHAEQRSFGIGGHRGAVHVREAAEDGAPGDLDRELGRDDEVHASEHRRDVDLAQARREDLLEARLRELETPAPGVPRLFLLEGEYMAALVRAEMKWLRGVVGDLRGGWLRFPTLEEIMRIAPDQGGPSEEAIRSSRRRRRRRGRNRRRSRKSDERRAAARKGTGRAGVR